MARPGSGPVGRVHHDCWLPYSIQMQAASDQTPGFHFGPGCTTCSGPAGRAVVTSREGCYQAGAQPQSRGWVLLPILLGSEEGWWPAPHLGSQRSEPVPSPTPMQNANSSQGQASPQPGGLVCNHRSQGCIFPDPDLEGSLEIPEVRFRGTSLRIQSPSFWDSSRSQNLHSLYGRSSVPSEAEGSQNTELSRRLASVRDLRGAVSSASGSAFTAHSDTGSSAESAEEQLAAVSGHCVSGYGFELRDRHYGADSGETAGIPVLPQSFSAPVNCDMGSLSSTHGHDGGHGAGCTTGAFTHASSSETTAASGSEFPVISPVQSRGLQRPIQSPPMVAHSDSCSEGKRTWACSAPPTSVHRRVSKRLGRSARRRRRARPLVWQLAGATHKRVGTQGGLRCSTSLSSEAEGSPCDRAYRQHCRGGLRQQAGRSRLSCSLQSSNEALAVGSPSVSISEGCARSRPCKFSRGHAFEGRSFSWRMETPPHGGVSDLASLRHSSSRSVCIQGDNALSSVLFTEKRQPTTGVGCVGSSMALDPVVCLSPVHAPAASPQQDSNGGDECDPGGTALAPDALVLAGSPSPERDTLGASGPQGPSVSGLRDSFSPLPGGPQAGRLAPERDGLLALGLDEAVVKTMQESRAPSTRALYSFRWRVFSEWCSVVGVDPFSATAGDILRFLQSQLDRGKSSVTLRGFIAAIKAARIGDSALGDSDSSLISRFLKGAQRLNVGRSRSTVPSWDLDIVLEALRQPPYEPLTAAELKWLTLKTSFLLAIASARRIGELHALSVHDDCCTFSPDRSSVVLRPNPAFLPKVVTDFHLSQRIELRSLCTEGEQSLDSRHLALCPVRALSEYMVRTRSSRQSDQLFVCFDSSCLGRPVSKSRLSHWIVDTIKAAYVSSGAPPPSNIRAHSTRAVSTSWALWRGASLATICAAATWSSQSTFATFYRLNVAATPSFGEQVLRR